MELNGDEGRETRISVDTSAPRWSYSECWDSYLKVIFACFSASVETVRGTVESSNASTKSFVRMKDRCGVTTSRPVTTLVLTSVHAKATNRHLPDAPVPKDLSCIQMYVYLYTCFHIQFIWKCYYSTVYTTIGYSFIDQSRLLQRQIS